VRGEPELSIALDKGWQPTFDAKPFDHAEASKFMEEVGDLGSFNESTPDPNYFHMYRAIKKGKNNSPGPNGIPNAPLQHCPRAPSLFLEIDAEIKMGSMAPVDFNLSLGWFPPKGDFDSDVVEVIRSPADTRPLSGNNTDNKTIVLANVLVLEPQYRCITHKSENGFVTGRNFLRNLVDVDAAARIFSMKHAGANPKKARREDASGSSALTPARMLDTLPDVELLKVVGHIGMQVQSQVKLEVDDAEDPVKIEHHLKNEPDEAHRPEGCQRACSGNEGNCFLPRTALKSPNGHLLLVDHLEVGREVLAVDGARSLVQKVHFQKYQVVELVTRLRDFKESACHRIIVVGQDGATARESVARDLAVGDRVLVGTREVRVTKVTHLEMWTELISISFDRDVAVEGFIAPLLGMQTLGEPHQARASNQEPSAAFDLLGFSRYSAEDLCQAMPLRYED